MPALHLPAAPVDNEPHTVVNVGACPNNTLTISGNGHNIGLSAAAIVSPTAGATSVRYSAARGAWENLGLGAASHVQFGAIDSTPIGATTPSTGVFSTLGMVNPGIFTNTQMNNFATVILNGYNIGASYLQSGGFGTEALAGAIAVPSTSTVYQADAVAGFIANASGTATKTVAGYFQATAASNNASIWGLNPIVADNNKHVSNWPAVMNGIEVDANADNAGTNLVGLLFGGASNAKALARTIVVKSLGASVQWDRVLDVQDGVAAAGIRLGGVSATGTPSTNSIDLEFTAFDSGGTTRVTSMFATPNGLEVSRSLGVGADPTFGTLQVHPSAGINFIAKSISGTDVFVSAVNDSGSTIAMQIGGAPLKLVATKIIMASLPIACTGQVTGTLWNNSNVVSLCP
ncbi:MAG TPA: hypothetical protein VHA53_06645 [Nitrolancea sp.]|nr:hypothetical protein [Nitrolancea sp.]